MTARALQQLPITGVVHGPQQVRCARSGVVDDTDRCLACPDLHALVVGDGDGRSWVLCGFAADAAVDAADEDDVDVNEDVEDRVDERVGDATATGRAVPLDGRAAPPAR